MQSWQRRGFGIPLADAEDLVERRQGPHFCADRVVDDILGICKNPQGLKHIINSLQLLMIPCNLLMSFRIPP